MVMDWVNVLVLLVGVGLAFFISRWVASRWRNRREDRAEKAERAAESRQVRRARERRGKG